MNWSQMLRNLRVLGVFCFGNIILLSCAESAFALEVRYYEKYGWPSDVDNYQVLNGGTLHATEYTGVRFAANIPSQIQTYVKSDQYCDFFIEQNRFISWSIRLDGKIVSQHNYVWPRYPYTDSFRIPRFTTQSEKHSVTVTAHNPKSCICVSRGPKGGGISYGWDDHCGADFSKTKFHTLGTVTFEVDAKCPDPILDISPEKIADGNSTNIFAGFTTYWPWQYSATHSYVLQYPDHQYREDEKNYGNYSWSGRDHLGNEYPTGEYPVNLRILKVILSEIWRTREPNEVKESDRSQRISTG